MLLYQKFPIFTNYRFFNAQGDSTKSFSYSSDIEKIGIEWDVSIQNGTYIDVISDPVEITRPQYGTFSVLKVRADVATDYHTIIKEFWVPTHCVIKVKIDEPTRNIN